MKFERSAGVLLNPTSLPSSYGIGDLGKAAYKFADYLEKAGMKLWQILPLTHTSFGDSPYQGFSAFAGNPLLISLDSLMEEGLLSEGDLCEEGLNDIPSFSPNKTDYGKVLDYKTQVYKRAYANFIKKNDTADFENFKKENDFWLDDYALFIAIKYYFIELRKNEWESKEYQDFYAACDGALSDNLVKDYYYGGVWVSWSKNIRARQAAAMKTYRKKLENEIEYYKFIQFKFFEQWHKLKKYVNDKGIKIIGDIPIFVAYDSADVWANAKAFHLDTKGFPKVVAGVPPDYFSATGQLWGNPLYKWDYHKKNGYSWWISRIKHTLALVDIVRIDHFRGFEAYWEVPFGDKTAENGKWVKGPNKALFDAMKAELGELPVIAEDLGVITPEVEQLRDSCGFPGMRVLQFAFDDSEENVYLPHFYDKNTVAYTGTHDNDTTNGWYEKATEFEKDKFRRYMNVDGSKPAESLIRLVMSSAADMAIFPLQDVLELGEYARMNTPSQAAGNWQWRYTEDMLSDEKAEMLKYFARLFNR